MISNGEARRFAPLFSHVGKDQIVQEMSMISCAVILGEMYSYNVANSIDVKFCFTFAIVNSAKDPNTNSVAPLLLRVHL